MGVVGEYIDRYINSGHFGITKTCKRLTERFYSKGITNQAKDLVSYTNLPHTNASMHACMPHTTKANQVAIIALHTNKL